MSTDLSSFTFCAARFPPLDSSFIVLGDVTPTYKEKKWSKLRKFKTNPRKALLWYSYPWKPIGNFTHLQVVQAS